MIRKQLIRDFIRECPSLGLRATWGALSANETRELNVRQIRKVNRVLAIAKDPILDNVVVLTVQGYILNLSPAELISFERV